MGQGLRMHRGANGIVTIGPAPVDPRADQTMVSMRDGVRLSTNVYLPQAPRSLPTVFMRVPYDQNARYAFLPALVDWFLDRGYAFVTQDVRGKFRSEGETTPYRFEVQDGYDSLDWIVGQPWSNGAVGMFGDSYYGWTQWAAVASRHRSLRAIVPRVASANAGSIRFRTSPDEGIVHLFMADMFAEVWADNNMYETTWDWSIRPLDTVFDAFFNEIGSRASSVDAMMHNQRAIDPYPWGHAFTAPEVPALHSVGWFDNIGPQSMQDFMTVRGRGWANQYLIGEPTDHESYVLDDVPYTVATDHSIDDAALERMIPRYLVPGLDFLDVFVAGTRSVQDLKSVRWRPGNGHWSDADTWPPPGFTPRQFYLEAGNDSDNTLSVKPPTQRGVLRWTHDPDHLVPSTVVNTFGYLHEYPDESVVAGRDDVLTFTTDAVSTPTTLAGPVLLSVNFSAPEPNAHLYAKLCVVEPDGSSRMLTRGEAMVPFPAEERLTSIYLGHTAHVLREGERLRVQIASSDFPLYLPWFGDARNPWQATSGKRVQLAISCGGNTPSRLEVWCQ